MPLQKVLKKKTIPLQYFTVKEDGEVLLGGLDAGTAYRIVYVPLTDGYPDPDGIIAVNTYAFFTTPETIQVVGGYNDDTTADLENRGFLTVTQGYGAYEGTEGYLQEYKLQRWNKTAETWGDVYGDAWYSSASAGANSNNVTANSAEATIEFADLEEGTAYRVVSRMQAGRITVEDDSYKEKQEVFASQLINATAEEPGASEDSESYVIPKKARVNVLVKKDDAVWTDADAPVITLESAEPALLQNDIYLEDGTYKILIDGVDSGKIVTVADGAITQESTLAFDYYTITLQTTTGIASVSCKVGKNEALTSATEVFKVVSAGTTVTIGTAKAADVEVAAYGEKKTGYEYSFSKWIVNKGSALGSEDASQSVVIDTTTTLIATATAKVSVRLTLDYKYTDPSDNQEKIPLEENRANAATILLQRKLSNGTNYSDTGYAQDLPVDAAQNTNGNITITNATSSSYHTFLDVPMTDESGNEYLYKAASVLKDYNTTQSATDHLNAILSYEPNCFEAKFEIDGSKLVTKPSEIHVKIRYRDFGEEEEKIITQHEDSYIVATHNGDGIYTGSYPVWSVDQNENPYDYHITIVSYKIGNAVISEDNQFILQYHAAWIHWDAGTDDATGMMKANLKTIPVENFPDYVNTVTNGGGTITGGDRAPIKEDEEKTYTITPDEDHRILDVLVDGVSQGAAENVVVVGNGRDQTILAVFTDKDNFIVDVTSSDGGSTTETGRHAVEPGETFTVWITPEEGYYIKDVLVNGVSVGATDALELLDISEDYNIVPLFAPKMNLNAEDHFAYIVGRPDGLVHPLDNITREETAAVFFRLLSEETRNKYGSDINSFSDVASESWSNRAISTLAAASMISGRTATTFDPTAPITRAEFVAIAARFSPTVKGMHNFTDISGHWAEQAISSAAEYGWIQVDSGLFRPNDYITRAEAITMINRVLNRVPGTTEDLLDDMIQWQDNMDTDVWFYFAIQEATNSHKYILKEDGRHETWTEITASSDWSELEKNN